jgi:SIR2-like domain
MDPVETKIAQLREQLVSPLKKGECILFLGSGVHAPPDNLPYTYPVEQRLPHRGADLAERLAEGYRFIEKFPEEESSSGDLQRVSMFIESDRFFGRKYLIDELEKHLRDNNKKKPSPALKMLAALPFKIIVTTNFDLLLDNALQEAGKTPVRIVYNPSLGKPTKDMVGVPTAERPLLFKMHGDLDQRESIVITDEDYITFIQRMSEKESAHPVPRTVRTGMMTWPTLFVGYSLRDYNLRLLFRTLR